MAIKECAIKQRRELPILINKKKEQMTLYVYLNKRQKISFLIKIRLQQPKKLDQQQHQ